MKIHWGTGIAAAFAVFIAGMAVLVLTATTRKVDLVVDRYYDQGIRYQERIDALRRARAVAETVRVEVEGTDVTFRFPARFRHGPVRGTIAFYRPSDRSRDFALPISPDALNAQRVPAAALQRGAWRVQLAWREGGQDFYQEERITVP